LPASLSSPFEKTLFRVAAVRRVPLLPTPDKDLLEEALVAPLGNDEHDRLAAALPCLHLIEYRDPPSPRVLGPEVKIAAWNAERCKYLSPTAALLAGIDADVVLLSEMDIGMARSGNRHTISELAGILGTGYAFGVEYVELGLGDDREKSWHAGQSNAVSLHGNGILTHAPLDHLDIIRLDEDARWFAGHQTIPERRIGWRMAIGASLNVGGLSIFVVSVHLESSTDADDRARQVSRLIEGVEQQARDLPIIIGGDFNTSALPLARSPDPSWFTSPGNHEPLFERFRNAGYQWTNANEAVATERTRPDGTPVPPFRRIDWFFTRGLAVSKPGTISATDPRGVAISDHDILTLTVAAGQLTK
jgi:endonuclease/exonuclease/phosphatase family metal-dependent hydrolase